jgi:hypothetical protein
MSSEEASIRNSRLRWTGSLFPAAPTVFTSCPRAGMCLPEVVGLVAHLVDGQQVDRGARVGLDLLAQVQDVYVDGSLGDVGVDAPADGEQLAPGTNMTAQVPFRTALALIQPCSASRSYNRRRRHQRSAPAVCASTPDFPWRSDVMSALGESVGAGSDHASEFLPRRTRGGPDVKVQPVPRAAARIISTGGRGVARDRLRLIYGWRYRQAMAVMVRALPESQSPLGSLRHDRVSALADLAAVYLYLDGEWEWIDPALLGGTAGGHLPLARCTASGLRRLPSYRGPAIVHTSTVGMVTDWYRENQFVVDHGFWTASTSASALSEGGPGFLVWSLTGRLTRAVDPYAPGVWSSLPAPVSKYCRSTRDGGPSC